MYFFDLYVIRDEKEQHIYVTDSVMQIVIGNVTTLREEKRLMANFSDRFKYPQY